MATANKRILYLDYLRIISALWVIVIHVCCTPWLKINVTSFGWGTLTFYDSLAQCAVPVFFMISGALFLNPQKELPTKRIYTKYIPPLLVSFAVWSLIYIIFNKDYTKGPYTILKNLLKGSFHMWFIPAMIGLYMMLPLLRKITESRELTRYFLLLFVILVYLVPTAEKVIALIPLHGFSSVSKLLSDFTDTFIFRMVMGYSGFMVLGHFLHTHEFSKKGRRIVYVLGIFGFLFTLSATILLSLSKNHATDTFMTGTSLGVGLFAVSIFTFFKYFSRNIEHSEKKVKFISLISDSTYGIYLVHIIVIRLFKKKLLIDAMFFRPIVTVPLLAIAVFIVSLLIVRIIKLIPKINKYIV